MGLLEPLRKIWRFKRLKIREIRISPGGDTGVIESRIIQDTLCQDEKLMSILAEPPSAYVLPAGKSATGEYVIIWLFLQPESVSYSHLINVISSAVRLPHEKSCYAGLIGVEVVPCLRFTDGSADRVVRVCVHDGCYHIVEELDSRSIRKATPVEGISCSWYWEPNSVEKEDKNRSWFVESNNGPGVDSAKFQV